VRKLKHEDGFDDTKNVFHHDIEARYGDAQDADVRARWMEEKKVLFGPFVPSGTTKSIGNAPTRKLLPDILKELHEAISRDWEECGIVIAPTEDGNIAVIMIISSQHDN
jgi:hypothetical protein